MTSYWLSDICSLTNSLNINPFYGDDKNFQYNSLTRLIILITIVSAYFFQNEMISILISGVLSIVISAFIYYLTFNKTGAEKLENIDGVHVTEQGSKNLEDASVNSANLVTLDYVPNDTEKKKHIFMLEGDKMPDKIIPTKMNPNDYLSSGNHVAEGSVKKLSSLLGKNLNI